MSDMLETIKKNPKFLDRPGQLIDFGKEKWGVLFLNMGGPETAGDIPSYLYRIFSDRNVIRMPIPSVIQNMVARIIASRRAPKVARRYQMIGGGSPLLKWTRLAASGVKRELSRQYPHIEIFVGMRYTEPFIHEELDAAVVEGCRHLVILPMYPHYCRATTGTALEEVLKWARDRKTDLSFSVIDSWHDRPGYIELLRRNIDAAIDAIGPGAKPKLIFSAHAIPQTLAQSGDPYLPQVNETAARAGEGYDYIISFQSRTGPVSWVGPDTVETVKTLASQGVTEMVIVPISFVSDHIETLYDIDIDLKSIAEKAGVKKFIRTESFNDDPRFAAFLATLVEEKISAG
jgi:ferrochelatase